MIHLPTSIDALFVEVDRLTETGNPLRIAMLFQSMLDQCGQTRALRELREPGLSNGSGGESDSRWAGGWDGPENWSGRTNSAIGISGGWNGGRG